MNNEQQAKAKNLGLIISNTSSRKRWLIITVIAVLLIAGMWWWLDANKEVDVLYKTAAVKRMDLALTVSATGNVTPKDQVEVSSELSGILEDVFVDYNDKVTVGQKLAQLDISKLRATLLQRKSSLRSAQAQVKSAKANLEEAQLNHKYYQGVWKASGGKHPSQQTMDNARVSLAKAEAGLEQALASVDNAKAELEYTESDLEKSTLVSPIDGVVLSRSVEPGQTVASSFSAPTLFLLARDLKVMELIVAVDEADIGVVEVGQKATFTVDAYRGRQFEAEITQIRLAKPGDKESASTSSVVSYSTVLSVDNDDLALLPGMTAVSEIAVASANNTLAIENAALRYQPTAGNKAQAEQSRGIAGALIPRFRRTSTKKAGEETVVSEQMNLRDATIWVLRNNKPVEIAVKVGISNGIHTQVVSDDLQEGELVISDAVVIQK